MKGRSDLHSDKNGARRRDVERDKSRVNQIDISPRGDVIPLDWLARLFRHRVYAFEFGLRSERDTGTGPDFCRQLSARDLLDDAEDSTSVNGVHP